MSYTRFLILLNGIDLEKAFDTNCFLPKQIRGVDYRQTDCSSSHMTSFAAGFFILPNTIDFEYVFANASFSNNLTIYFTIIITLIIWILLLIWAR